MCPICKHKLEQLIYPDTQALAGLYGCFNGCKYPDNRWVPYGVIWRRLSEEPKGLRGF